MEKTMFDYIKETPVVVDDIIENSKEYTKELVSFYQDNFYEGIQFIASGSSYNGTLIALPFIKHILKFDIKLTTPFTFENHEMDYVKKEMLVGVSQSGCSTNTLSVLEKLKEKGYKTSCLVGRNDCDAKDIADLTVNWKVGEEKVGFVTKGVTSLACFLMCFALELAKARNIITDEEYDSYRQELKKTMSIQKEIVDNTVDIFNRHKEDFLNPKRVVLLSSGPGFGIISEGALKIAETSCLTALAYEAEEFLHGPIYPSTPDDLIILVDNNDDKSSKRIIDIALALKDITDKVYVITDSDQIDEEHRFSTAEHTGLYTSVLYRLSCLQTLANLMTENTNHYEPHDCVKAFKKANKVASKTRDNLYLNLQNIK
ncbi:MAG: SIS domain-containing protein [Erysipelotrichaceae bacterium]|nr:SIS domain-containing protein [Erysipelotrichaceae bacterium]